MWPVFIVPESVPGELPPDGFKTQGNEDTPEKLILQGFHKTFYNGDAAVLANSAKAWPDSSVLAPRLKSRTPELRALGDKVLWRRFGSAHGPAEKGSDLQGRRCRFKDDKPHDAARVVPRLPTSKRATPGAW